MTQTRVDVDELRRVEADIRSTVRHIEEQLAGLRAALGLLRGTWSGEAGAAWQYHQRRWDEAAADLATSLTSLHQVVSVARSNYAAAIAANVRSWTP